MTTQVVNSVNSQKGSYTNQMFSFPLSHETIEVITTKNLDGSFKKAECIAPQIRNAWNKLNDLLLSYIKTPNTEDKYYVKVINSGIINIKHHEMRSLHGEPKRSSIELGTKLRGTMNARILYPEDRFNLHIALNGQGYYDVLDIR